MKLNYLERIRRIEKAPKEVQTKVAKAYLRDDIDDEQVQYLFNTMSLEEMNDKSVIIENKNAKQKEGIGADGFTMRTSMPYDNKQYITRGYGGYSSCIQGFPTQEHANVLANCVGYASGRFNELIELARDYHECTYPFFNCNAVYFADRAIENGFTVSDIPRVGSIMCWGGGNGDCGHVAVVERVDSNNQVYTSESDYGGTAFYNALRTNDNGRWGLSSSFYFRGFIYQEPDVQAWINGGGKVVDPVEPDIHKNQIEIRPGTTELYVKTAPSGNSGTVGLVQAGKYYNYYDMTGAEEYTWVKLAENQWVIYAKEWEILHPAQNEPTKEEIQKQYEERILNNMPKWLDSVIEK